MTRRSLASEFGAMTIAPSHRSAAVAARQHSTRHQDGRPGTVRTFADLATDVIDTTDVTRNADGTGRRRSS